MKHDMHRARGAARLATRLRSARAALALLATALVAGACAEEFEPRSEINYLRVLGVQASEPTLEVGDAATLTALIASPEAEPHTLAWEVCAATEGAEALRACATFDGVPSTFAQGEGASITVRYEPAFEALVNDLCAQAAALAERGDLPDGITIPDCSVEGLPATARLTVTAPSLADPLVAVKTLYLRPTGELAPQNAANDNPAIAGFEVFEVVNDDLRVALMPGDQVRRGETYELECPVDRDSIEDFIPRSADAAKPEELLWSWFVSGGELDRELSFYEEGIVTLEEAEVNEVTVLDDATSLRLWCVIRDGRGGIDWRQVELPVAP